MNTFRLLLVLLAISVPRPVAAASPAAGRPILLLIGLDGLRWDYLAKYPSPNLRRLAGEGVHAERMISSFPSITFPNFYTLATGLHPEHHGIVGNTMYDPAFKEIFTLTNGSPAKDKWWGGEPIWSTAEKQGVRAACMFWPGSEAKIAGVRPSAWLPYSNDYPMEKRVRTVLDWLALPPAQRPGLITLYCHEVDSAGHKYGPDAPETAAAVAQVDAAVGQICDGIHQLGLDDFVNIVIVADHGMMDVSPDRVVAISNLVDLHSVQVDFTGAVAGLRPLKGTAEDLCQAIAAKQQHFHAYLREELPERFHFRASPRIPPVVLVADEGWIISKQPVLPALRATFLKGSHGFDPQLPSMGATFIAKGPAFKTGLTIPPFENVEVYDLLCATLGLKPAPNDGSGSLAKQVLR